MEYLLQHGARIDIFAAALLGKLGVIKAILHETPDALHGTGPHGIPLIEHAKKGGNAETIAYLNHLINPEQKRASKPKSKSSKPAKSAKPKRRRAA